MIRRSTLVMVVLTGAVSVAVFSVKYRVQALEEDLGRLNAEIVDDREAIEVLRAEWSHLNDPARLSRLASRYLDMAPIDSSRVNPVARLDDVLVFKAPERALAERDADTESPREMLQ